MRDSVLADFHRRRGNSLPEAYRYLHLRTPEFIGLWVVALFYSAMHRIQEYIMRSGDVPPENHHARGDYVRRKMIKIHRAYRRLYNMGHRSRYIPEYATTPGDVDDAWALYGETTAFLPWPCAPGVRGGAPRSHLGPPPCGT